MFYNNKSMYIINQINRIKYILLFCNIKSYIGRD